MMSLLQNDYTELFGKYSEAIAVEKKGDYIFINEPAARILSSDGGPLPLTDWVPAEILSSEALSICAVTEINGGRYMITLSRLGDMRIFMIRPQENRSVRNDDELIFLNEVLKSPLAALSAASNAMLPIVEGMGSEELSKNLAIIYQNYFKLMRISNMLSAYNKMRLGSIVLKTANIDLIALCKNLVNTISLLTKERGVRIWFSTNLKSADTEADFDRIEYVLLNILSNSLKHTKTGDDIKISLSSTSSYFIVTVTVLGAAIPQEYLPKVFETVFHHQDASDIFNYFGLGLAYSNEIIKAHGGFMLIESRTGQGTEIRFTLPIKQVGGFADAPVRYGEKGMVPILTYLSDILPLDCYDAKYLD